MSSSVIETAGLSTTFDSHREGTPDLRLLHFNDVYHVESSSAEPAGGAARFQTLVNYYRSDPRFDQDPSLLTFFSGDAFNPSLESTVTKGRHMVPFLNRAGTDVACVGNHDLDFGIAQFRHLRDQCKFPWLLANVLDPALGEGVPLANCEKTFMLEVNGIKVGVIGLGEREWLATINALPPNLIYKSASATAIELVPQLRAHGAELIVAVTHQREPNDNKLADKVPPGLIDIILGGHDHYYAHSVRNGVHILRSGTDFKQLSYIQAWRKTDTTDGWDFTITRRDVLREIPKHPDSIKMVHKLTANLRTKLQKPIGYTATPLDARFTTVRRAESNIGNFVCDLMRFYHGTDCAMMAAGTIRGDQVYPPGVLRIADILKCFPFEDPVVVLKLKGKAIRAALENGVSELPALEGRFPQVSNIFYGFAASAPRGSRIHWAKIDGEDIDDEKFYTLATRGYMARGKDGFTMLLAQSEGGEAEEVVSEEDGLLISTIVRQYFLSLKVVGKWKHSSRTLNRHWDSVHQRLHYDNWKRPPTIPPASTHKDDMVLDKDGKSGHVSPFHYITRVKSAPIIPLSTSAASFPDGPDFDNDSLDSESDSEPEILTVPRTYITTNAKDPEEADRREYLARTVLKKWRHKAGLDASKVRTVDEAEEGELPPWTRVIAPTLERRIVQVDDKSLEVK